MIPPPEHSAPSIAPAIPSQIPQSPLIRPPGLPFAPRPADEVLPAQNPATILRQISGPDPSSRAQIAVVRRLPKHPPTTTPCHVPDRRKTSGKLCPQRHRSPTRSLLQNPRLAPCPEPAKTPCAICPVHTNTQAKAGPKSPATEWHHRIPDDPLRSARDCLICEKRGRLPAAPTWPAHHSRFNRPPENPSKNRKPPPAKPNLSTRHRPAPRITLSMFR